MSDEISSSVAPAAETEPQAEIPSDPTPAEEAMGTFVAEPVVVAPAVATPVVAAAPVGPTVDKINFGDKPDPTRGRRKVQIGKVASSKMEKTVVVVVESKVRHPLYGKIMRRTTRFKAHDEANTCGDGDIVEIMETRPLSKDKRWRVTRIVEKAK